MSYGTDIWCTGEMVSGRRAKGSTVVAQALYRRLITPRGMLRGGDDESAYGFDIAGFVGAVGYPAAVAQLPGQVANELEKDQRVQSVAVTAAIERTPSGLMSITLNLDVKLYEEDESFSLVVGVNDTSVTLLGGTA